jgi:hypothetical protein
MTTAAAGEGCARAALRGCVSLERGRSMGFSCFAMFMLVSAMLYAQPAVVVAPLDKSIPPGVTIVPPSDPSFGPLVDGLVPVSARPVVRPILPYSIVVRNNSTLPILVVTIYADVVDAQGRLSSVGQAQYSPGGFPFVKNNPHPLLPQGGSVFFPPDEVYTTTIRLLQQNMPVEARFYNKTLELPAFYDSARSVTFVLDSLLFADGKFVGPDKAHWFEDWSNRTSAHRALDEAVLSFRGRSVDDLKAYLAKPPRGPANSRWGGEVRHRAKVYEDYLRQKGPDALFDDVQIDEERLSSLPIHR